MLYLRPAKRVHTSDRRSPTGASLAAETSFFCHRTEVYLRARQRFRVVSIYTCLSARFLGSNLRRRASSFIGRGNLIRRPGAAHVSRRQAGRPVAHCIDARKTHPAESASCDELPESVNAARISARISA